MYKLHIKLGKKYGVKDGANTLQAGSRWQADDKE